MPSETPFLPAGTAARRSYCKFAQTSLKDLQKFGTVDWRSMTGLGLSTEFKQSQRVPGYAAASQNAHYTATPSKTL